jgi:hypothetical protein
MGLLFGLGLTYKISCSGSFFGNFACYLLPSLSWRRVVLCVSIYGQLLIVA